MTPDQILADDDDSDRQRSTFDRADNTARLALELAEAKREIARLHRDALAEAQAYRAMFARAQEAEAKVAKVEEVLAGWWPADIPGVGSADCAEELSAALKDARAVDASPSVAEMACAFSLWLNSTYPEGLCEEAVFWRRVGKISEEAGEVREASGAYWHENPRKPIGPIEDVIAELADCVGAALGAIEHLTEHKGRSLAIASERIQFACERVGVVVPNAPS